MRDSFGGAFMIKLLLIFIVVFVSFMAVAISYARAFRVKNAIINIIEQYQYSGTAGDPVLVQIEDYLNNIGYNDYRNNTNLSNSCTNSGGSFVGRGVCIIPYDRGEDSNGQPIDRYYRVIAYINAEMPFFQINMTIPVSGETKIIH